MRHLRLATPVAIGAVLLAIELAPWASWSEEAAEPKRVAIKTVVAPRAVREYRIDAVIEGKAPSPGSGEPADVDAAFQLKVRHHYSRREGDGLLPLEISLVEGQVTVQAVVEGKKAPQTLQIAPGVYPKLTVLIDRDWRITDILGMSSAAISQTVPGIGYGNHIILFFPQGAEQPHAPGDKWESSVKLPSLGETYSFTNTLVGEKTVDGVRAAAVRQEIVRVPKEEAQGTSAAMKATADSVFAMEDGRLLKSHVECEVTFPPKGASQSGSTSRQDNPASRANMRIDISLVKPSSS